MKRLNGFLVIYLIAVFCICCSNDDSNNTPNTQEPNTEDPNPPSGEISLLDISTDSPNIATWVPRESMTSRNGNSMGYGVILNPESDKLIIFLDGGGACYNSITCAQNADKYTKNDFEARLVSEDALILNRVSNDNQFRDWNFVFIPYATGDVHSGANTMANVPFNGPTNQVMTGYTNVTVVLNDLKNYFEDTSTPQLNEIVFSGSSAGGYGTLFNVPQLANTFGTEVSTTILVDSGQLFLNNTILTPCLEDIWSNLWLWDSNLPPDLDSIVTETYNFDVQKYYDYLALKYPSFNFGFLSSYEDEVIRGFYSFGLNDCPAIPSVFLSGSAFKAGLEDLKTLVLDGHDNWKVFYTNGDFHTFLGSSTLSQSVNGITLNEWIQDLRSGTAIDLTE